METIKTTSTDGDTLTFVMNFGSLELSFNPYGKQIQFSKWRELATALKQKQECNIVEYDASGGYKIRTEGDNINIVADKFGDFGFSINFSLPASTWLNSLDEFFVPKSL